ncbi:MAG: FliH/SctL family protein [Rhodospirillaceae bacterium]
MARNAKFLFERSFDDPSKLYLPGERRRSEIEAEAAADAAARLEREMEDQLAREAAHLPPPPPVARAEYTQAQLDAAKEEGYIQGHGAALEEAATAREHYAADALNLIAQGLSGLNAQQAETNKELANFAMRMVYGLAQRLLPRHAQAHAVDSIEEFVRRVLPLAVGEPRLVVRSHPMISEDLEARLTDVFARSSFQGTFTVVTDYEVQPGDCRLEWEGGGAERNEARIWAEIREVIAGNFGDVDLNALDTAADQMMAHPASVETPPDETPPDEAH